MPCSCVCYNAAMFHIHRLQQYARDARKEYTELSQKDLTQLKSFVKGLPKLMMLDRLSDIASPVAEQVGMQAEQHTTRALESCYQVHLIIILMISFPSAGC